MPIRPQLAFGPIAKAIDTIVADAEKTESRLFQLRRDEEKRDQQEKQLRIRSNFRTAVEMAGDKSLTDETRKAAFGSIPKLLTDPDAQLVEPQFKPPPPPEQTFSVSQALADANPGIQVGTKVTISELNTLVDNKRLATAAEDKRKTAETKAKTVATEKADRKKRQESKDFVGALNREQSDLRTKLRGLQKTEFGEKSAIAGKEDEVSEIELRIKDLVTVERIADGQAEPESFLQIRGWVKNGILSDERAKEMVEEFGLEPESIEQVKDWIEKKLLSEERGIDIVEEFDLDATTR